MLSKSIFALLLVASVAYGQTIINIIQFSDDYCLCPNQQKLSLVDECLAVLGGYEVYRYAEGSPAEVWIQSCSDKECTQCVNQTIYDALPPCQADQGGLFFYSVLPEDDVTTYFNAPSIVTSRYANASCGGDVVHLEISYGLSCFVTAEGSYYYSCPEGDTSEYSYFNCSDNACQECEENTMPTEQCTNDEGVWKSVQCTASSSTTTTANTATSQTATSQTATATSQTATSGNTNNNVNSASASVSTTTSASSHNVSSSASAAGGTAGSATSGGAVHAIYSDVRGGMMKKKEPRANPPFCNGGVPQSTGQSVATATSAGTGGSSGGSSGGMKGQKHGIPVLL